jgi:hypothetical protein
MVLLESDEPKLRLFESLGFVKPRVVSNYGGYQVTPRQRELGLTDWIGRDPIKVHFDILFDEFRAQRSVEGRCRTLERMAGMWLDDPEPPLLTVDAVGAIPHDNSIAPNRRWVVETLEWSDEFEERLDRGDRCRAVALVTLMQYVEDRRIKKLSAAHQRRKKKKQKKRRSGRRGSGRRRATVRPSDTLMSIASEHLGDQTRWPEIAELNGLRDPRLLIPGQEITLP